MILLPSTIRLTDEQRAAHLALHDVYDAWWSGLKRNERWSMLGYKWLGSRKINARLREEKGRRLPTELKDRLDKAFGPSPTWPRPATMWRGEMHRTAKVYDVDKAAGDLASDFPVGDEFSQLGFTSWSLSPAIAAGFTNTPRHGAPLFWRTTFSSGVYAGYTGARAEYDIIVPPSTLIVRSVTAAPYPWEPTRRKWRGDGRCVIIDVDVHVEGATRAVAGL